MNADQFQLTELPFEPEDHAFTPEGNVYLLKHALRRRLFRIDPRWTIDAPTIIDANDNIIVLRASLTVCGVSRWGVGTGIVQRVDEGRAFLQQKMIAKAYKTAASDLLPRCAAEFNIGWYLRIKAAQQVKTPEQLRAYLKSLTSPAPSASRHDKLAAWLDRVMRTYSLNQADVLDALAVESIDDWMGTAEQADKAIDTYIARQLEAQS